MTRFIEGWARRVQAYCSSVCTSAFQMLHYPEIFSVQLRYYSSVRQALNPMNASPVWQMTFLLLFPLGELLSFITYLCTYKGLGYSNHLHGIFDPTLQNLLRLLNYLVKLHQVLLRYCKLSRRSLLLMSCRTFFEGKLGSTRVKHSCLQIHLNL